MHNLNYEKLLQNRSMHITNHMPKHKLQHKYAPKHDFIHNKKNLEPWNNVNMTIM